MSLITLGAVTVSASGVRVDRAGVGAHLVASNVAPSLENSQWMLLVTIPLTREEHAALVGTTVPA